MTVPIPDDKTPLGIRNTPQTKCKLNLAIGLYLLLPLITRCCAAIRSDLLGLGLKLGLGLGLGFKLMFTVEAMMHTRC